MISPIPLDLATILIVDDNPTNLKVLSEAIASSGWEILVATDGETAIEQAEYAQPHLILLDVMMPPGIDGFETCRRLQQNPKTVDIPIIFMTALDDTVDKIKGLSIGAVDYITKPFRTEEVLARAKVHLKLYFVTKQLEQQKAALEQRVAQRTEELSETLKNLQQSQLQLVQNEKMSALGQLVAGVAHEINNPVGFIAGNLSHASGYVQDLMHHLQLYQEKFPVPGEEILANAEEIDVNYIFQDFPQLISSMKEGTDRIRNISASLRTFSRADQAQPVPFNLHEGIDSTLIILKHRIKGNDHRTAIEVIRDYGTIPDVVCYPGQLNQVFMNIIANAIDALDQCALDQCALTGNSEVQSPPQWQIIIQTQLVEPKTVMIRIKDNGGGMTPEVKEHIFDHLFTTKPVGQGTGLGLSIARQIIQEKHHGQLLCNSTRGQGTEFMIKLPSEAT